MPPKDPHSLKRCLLILSISLFSFANVAFAEPTHLVVNDSPNADDWSIQDRLVVGQKLYGDRDYVGVAVPKVLRGVPWIRPANDSKRSTHSPVATFEVTVDSRVFVAWDQRLPPATSWIGSWTSTDGKLGTSEGNHYELYYKDYAEGDEVELHPLNFSNSSSMYLTFVRPKVISDLHVYDSPHASDWSVEGRLQTGQDKYHGRTAESFFDDRIGSVPDDLADSEWIKPHVDSNAYSEPTLAIFEVNVDCQIWVAWDRTQATPTWLQDAGWGSKNLALNHGDYTFFVRTYTAGDEVNLGPASANGDMYLTVAKPLSQLNRSVITSLVVNDTANMADWSLQNGLTVGDRLYGDREYRLRTLPDRLYQLPWIRPANDSKGSSLTDLANFQVTQDSTIFIAWDHRRTRPQWLSSEYTDTDLYMDLKPEEHHYHIYAKDVSAGDTVTLGPIGHTSGVSMYIPIVEPAFLKPLDDPWVIVDGLKDYIAETEPTFPSNTCNIEDFGAVEHDTPVSANITANTNAFKAAIEHCANLGGGQVVVPGGDYFTGPIELKSNINLHVSDGGRIHFTENPNAYLPVTLARFEGLELMNFRPLISANGVENIGITGSGDAVIDGRYSHGWDDWFSKESSAKTHLESLSDSHTRARDRIFGGIVANGDSDKVSWLRPHMFQVINTKNIVVKDIQLENSPMYFINPILCQNLNIENITITGHGHNNDGIDPGSCEYIYIRNSTLDTGDDNIAVKSGADEDGRRIGHATNSVVIENMDMADGHGAVVLGSEIAAGVRNVYAQNIKAGVTEGGHTPESENLLRIKSNSQRGGVIERIYVRNTDPAHYYIGQLSQSALRINKLYSNDGSDTDGDYPPVVRNVTLEDVHIDRVDNVLYLRELPNDPDPGFKSEVWNIQFKNSTIDHVDSSKECDVNSDKGWTLTNVTIEGRDGCASH